MQIWKPPAIYTSGVTGSKKQGRPLAFKMIFLNLES